MKLFLFVALAMTAFAANSVLNRIGIAQYGMSPMSFAAIRVIAGAAMLWVLIAARTQSAPTIFNPKRFAGAATLATYMIGFSVAYQNLDAGVGALILFGALQVVIFGWAIVEKQSIPPLRWLGVATAFIGLCVLLWPTQSIPMPLGSVAAMIAAAVGWGAYTLLGRAEEDPLGATASNFLLCVPLVGIGLIGAGQLPLMGAITAVVAGALTSGLGYALWYQLLPKLATTVAGTAQLTVPVIAVAFGVAFLAEPLSLRLVIAGALVLGGIGLSLLVKR
ncbi:EamA family transporter [Loktanella sp. D2R18]|uniref:DMT family transporter n=1 Tax=Rhodobacterales TaxID=204455 RepID=UPI000DEBEE13|nr:MULTISPECIES: DMT family transporter [Rhodobacterales]MDO6590067.1 DMT family transporter [Yoonia sp. 1_MG-2023]RBW45807.1 EamA family transporter [Loktanella sp. D2R18]